MNWKLIPLLVFGLVFFGSLSFQVGNDIYSASAKEKDLTINKYEKYFQNLELKLYPEKKIRVRDIKKPLVLINFWASWCVPCVKEFKGLKFLKKSIGEKNIEIIGINNDSENPVINLKKTQKKYKLDFKSALDPNTKNLDLLGLENIPVTLIFHKGKLVYSNMKFTDFTSLDFLEKLKKYL